MPEKPEPLRRLSVKIQYLGVQQAYQAPLFRSVEEILPRIREAIRRNMLSFPGISITRALFVEDDIVFSFSSSNEISASAHPSDSTGARSIEISYGLLWFFDTTAELSAYAGSAGIPSLTTGAADVQSFTNYLNSIFSLLNDHALRAQITEEELFRQFPHRIFLQDISRRVLDLADSGQRISIDQIRHPAILLGLTSEQRRNFRSKPDIWETIRICFETSLAWAVGHEVAHQLFGDVDVPGSMDLSERRSREIRADSFAIHCMRGTMFHPLFLSMSILSYTALFPELLQFESQMAYPATERRLAICIRTIIQDVEEAAQRAEQSGETEQAEALRRYASLVVWMEAQITYQLSQQYSRNKN